MALSYIEKAHQRGEEEPSHDERVGNMAVVANDFNTVYEFIDRLTAARQTTTGFDVSLLLIGGGFLFLSRQ